MRHSRREFLQAGLGATTLLALEPTLPAIFARASAAAVLPKRDENTILVVVELAGGNDGLNTVVPFDDDHYGRNRFTLRLRANQVHKIDAHLGFHPKMESFARLFHDGLLSVVQGVGYSNPNRGHPSAMRIWQAADPSPDRTETGWLGRVVDQVYRPDESNMPAVFVGQVEMPFAMHGQKSVVPAVRAIEELTLRAAAGRGLSATPYLTEAAAQARSPGSSSLLPFVQHVTNNAYRMSQKVEAVARQSGNQAKYPQYRLAQRLSAVAQLIRADLGTRVFYTELGGPSPGGFDNHSNQYANHAAVLAELAESVAAFVQDLQRDKLLDRVVLMTFSEFGRSLAENGRRGTDHGAAAPMFLVGGRLKPGLIGPHPSLSDLDGNGLRFHTDFRRVYATLLDKWLGFDSRAVLGRQFPLVELLQLG